MRAGYIFTFALSLLLSTSVSADETQTRLDEINSKVDEQTARIDQISVKQKGIEVELKDLQKNLKVLNDKEATLNKDLEELQKKNSAVADQKRATDIELQKIQQISLERVKILYLHDKADWVDNLVFISRSSDLGKNAYLMGKVREFDRRLIDRFVFLKQQQDSQSAELTKLIKEQDVVKANLQTQQKEIRDKVNKQSSLLSSLKKEKSSLDLAVAELRAQALRMQTVLRSLTVPEVEISKTAKVKGEAPIRNKVEPFSGPGLEDLKGKLGIPIKGQIVAGFGKHKDQDFGTMVVNKGLSLKADADADVRVIAKGKVIFVGRMPSLGIVVIVDHGERYYSLYGKLSATNLTPGEMLEAHEIIGAVGEPDKNETNFYFEIRKNGTPLDPKPFLRS